MYLVLFFGLVLNHSSNNMIFCLYGCFSTVLHTWILFCFNYFWAMEACTIEVIKSEEKDKAQSWTKVHLFDKQK